MNVKFFVKSALASALALLSVNAFANDGQNVTANASISQPAGEALFFQCAAIIGNNERLACFDSLAQGEVPTTSEKQPLDLSATVGSTLRGKPRAVMADTHGGDNLQVLSGQSPEALSIDALSSFTGSSAKLEQYTPLSLAYDLDKNSDTGLWRARPHNPMYALPLFLNGNPNRSPSTPTQDTQEFSTREMRGVEAKFQISMKAKLAEDVFGTNADLWGGYTQQSHWQVYNEDESRPFRVHDYMPEVFITQPVRANLPFGGKLRMLGAGMMHHSNGESDPLSRSWNRAYVMGGMEWGDLTVMPRLWTRFARGDGSKPDDNPDILDYYGYGDVQFSYRLDQGKNIAGTLRYNPGSNKGAVQLDYVHPLGKGVSGYVQLFHGYGQSLIDYNHESTAIGVGVILNDWMGL